MFATYRQIAEAIVGPDLAEKWARECLPTLASKPGFPPIDAFHGGRPVWLVVRFYREYLRMPEDRANGVVPVWVADEAGVKAGYIPKTVSLKQFADQPDILAARCAILQAEMLLWRSGRRNDPMAFDGTVKSLSSIYQRHELSPFRKLKPSTKKTDISFLAVLEAADSFADARIKGRESN